MKHERLRQGILGGASLSDFATIFPAATTGMCVMYRGLAGWVADFVATSDISDIDLTGVAARSLLIYDLASSTFKAGYLSSDDLSDFDLTSLAAGSMLIYNGTKFTIVPSPTAAGQVLVSTSLFAATWATMYASNWWVIADHTPLETNEISLSVYTSNNEILVEDYDVIVI